MGVRGVSAAVHSLEYCVMTFHLRSSTVKKCLLPIRFFAHSCTIDVAGCQFVMFFTAQLVFPERFRDASLCQLFLHTFSQRALNSFCPQPLVCSSLRALSPYISLCSPWPRFSCLCQPAPHLSLHVPFALMRLPFKQLTAERQWRGACTAQKALQIQTSPARMSSVQMVLPWPWLLGLSSRQRRPCAHRVPPKWCSLVCVSERLHGFVALHRDYLRFMTVAFLCLRASFSGLAKMAKTAAAMFPETVFGANDCLSGLEHGWFLYSSLVAAWTPSLQGTSFDLRC